MSKYDLRGKLQKFHHIPTWVYISSLLILHILLALPFLMSPMIGEADAYVRALLVWDPWRNGHYWHINFTSAWLPFHALLLRSVLFLPADPRFALRMLTFVISSASIPLFFMYVRGYFPKSTTIIATCLYTLFPLQRILSTQTLTEGVYFPLFLIIIGILARQHIPPLLIIIVFFAHTLASGVRYDAWFLLPYIWTHIIIRIRSLALRIIILFASIIVPLWWIISTSEVTQTPLVFLWEKIHIAQQFIHPEYYNPYLSLNEVTKIFLEIFPVPFFILSVIGFLQQFALINSFSNKKNHILLLFWLMLPVYFLAWIYLQVYLGTMEWIPQRYLFVPTALLLPFLAFGAQIVVKKYRILGICLITSALIIIPSYWNTTHNKLTIGAFLDHNEISILPHFWNLIHYLTTHPAGEYQYVHSTNLSNTYYIAAAYFLLRTDLIYHVLIADTARQENFYLPDIIAENPVPDYLLLHSNIVYEKVVGQFDF